jgi:hypothetical protein
MKRMNEHEQTYNAEKVTARQKHLTNKFNPKSFSTEYRFLFYLVFGAAILFQLASLLTALTLPASWLYSVCYNWPLSFSVVFLFMLLLEIIKRFVASRSIKNGYQFKRWFSFGIVGAIFLSFISILSSTLGTPILIREFGATPPLVDTSGMALILQEEQNKINAFWSPQIVEAKQGAEDTHKANSWKGVTTRSARPIVLEYKAKAQKYQDSLNTSLTLLASNYSNGLLSIENQNKDILSKDKKDKASTGYILGFITLGLELLFLLSTFFLEYFDYREALELSKSESKSNSKSVKSAPKVAKSEQKEDKSKSTIGFFGQNEGHILNSTIAYKKANGELKYYKSAELSTMIGDAKKAAKKAKDAERKERALELEERAKRFETLKKKLKNA